MRPHSSVTKKRSWRCRPRADQKYVMSKYRPFFAIPLLGGILLSSTVVSAQDTGRWTTGAPMLSERSEVAVAEVGGNIIVVGGFGGQRRIEIYDPALDRWSRGAAVPRSLHHAAAVGLNGKLYVVGGYGNGWTSVDSLYEYDPAGNRWRALAPMPTGARRPGRGRDRRQDPRG